MRSLDYRVRYLEQTLADRYAFVRWIGEGGFASVYEVEHLQSGRREALKILQRDHHDEQVFARRFEREARLAASLDHPCIVPIHEYGDAHGIFWYSMPLIHGATLASIAAQGAMSEWEAVALVLPIVDALAHCHERGVIHRDVKPENILVDTDGVPHLMDFGLAKSTVERDLTRAGRVVGTPAYVAPEVVAETVVDGRADLYAVGVVLYQLIAGELPFADDGPAQTLQASLDARPRPIADLVPAIEPALARVIHAALARDPAERCASASAMHATLAALLPGGESTYTDARAATRARVATAPRHASGRWSRHSGGTSIDTVVPQRGSHAPGGRRHLVAAAMLTAVALALLLVARALDRAPRASQGNSRSSTKASPHTR